MTHDKCPFFVSDISMREIYHKLQHETPNADIHYRFISIDLFEREESQKQLAKEKEKEEKKTFNFYTKSENLIFIC